MKAILVIDMPDRCTECPLHFLDTPNNHIVKLWCGYNCKEVELNNNKIGYKPDWCPLKPVPEKQIYYTLNDYDNASMDGWNECIDTILGETE